MSIQILGCGVAMPKQCLTNTDLVNHITDTSDEWIQTRTGIKQRYIAQDESESTTILAYDAAVKALENANIVADNIDLIIVCTSTADHAFPGVGNKIQGMLSITNNIPSFDMQVACSGFVYGMQIADSLLNYHNKYSTALLICVDRMSSLISPNDRSTGVLFGDGAGALILKKNDNKNATIDNNISGIIDSSIYSDGKLASILYTEYKENNVNFSRINDEKSEDIKFDNSISMNGRDVFKHAVDKMCSSSIELVTKNNITLDDITYLIPHQANARIIKYIHEKIGIDEKKVVITLDKHANCSAASIPLAIESLNAENRIKTGDILLFTAFGAGATWGSMLFRF